MSRALPLTPKSVAETLQARADALVAELVNYYITSINSRMISLDDKKLANETTHVVYVPMPSFDDDYHESYNNIAMANVKEDFENAGYRVQDYAFKKHIAVVLQPKDNPVLDEFIQLTDPDFKPSTEDRHSVWILLNNNGALLIISHGYGYETYSNDAGRVRYLKKFNMLYEAKTYLSNLDASVDK